MGRAGLLPLLICFLFACQVRPRGTVVPVVTVDPPERLRELSPITVVFPSPNGGVTVVGTSGLGISLEQSTSGIDLVRRAGDLMRFHLQQVGFQVTADTTTARMIAELSMGGVRFDSQRGWIASEAVLLFRRPGSPAPVAAFKTSERLAMPGADSLIVALRRIVKSRY